MVHVRNSMAGLFNPSPVLLSYFALKNGIMLPPSHWLSKTSSHLFTAILCISNGQETSEACIISYATT
uniref:Uncharacterized protein n=1 Tax=Romanomermis culicivorax TaxID=13658 RepID=A0A915J7Z7_ROMCU